MANEQTQPRRMPTPLTGVAGMKLWAGKGSGARCARCGGPIASPDIEYELAPGASPNASHLKFHVRCFDKWRVAREHPDHADGHSGN